MKKLSMIALICSCLSLVVSAASVYFTVTCGSLSAYEVALQSGFSGTESEWLKSLTGEPGKDGKDGEDGENGKDGAPGKDGKDGENGKDGKDGNSWFSGNGAPDASLGEIEDRYLDLSDGTVYEKTADGWEIVGTLNTSGEGAKTVAVVFDAAGGDLPEGTEERATVLSGACLDLPVPERDGFYFLGWYYGEGVNETKVSPLTPFVREETKLTAKWQPRYVWDEPTVEQTESIYTVSCRYGGGKDAEISVFLKRGEEMLPLQSADDWLSYRDDQISWEEKWNVTLHLFFREAGEYTVIFRAEEDGFVEEASVTVTA